MPTSQAQEKPLAGAVVAPAGGIGAIGFLIAWQEGAPILAAIISGVVIGGFTAAVLVIRRHSRR